MNDDPLHCDLVIRGGTLVDGSGAARYVSDIAIRNDRIEKIGALSDITGRSEIDARGLIVAPGFIDVHTHDDLACIVDPEMTPKISQGISTVIVGNCGLSAAPVVFPQEPPEPFNLLGTSASFKYASFAAYAEAVAKAQPRVNVAALVGHSSLRTRCMDDLQAPVRDDQLMCMIELLEQALKEGALGMSSGVFYAPAATADVKELSALAAVVGRHKGVYTAHIRDEYDGVSEALREAFATTANHDLPLILSHHKCAGVRNWGRSAETLRQIDRAAMEQSVLLDCYPYTAGSTVIREDLVDEQIEVLINWSQPHPEAAGRNLKELAKEWGCSQAQAAARLAPGGASYFQIHEQDMMRILSHKNCMVGSDGLPTDPHPHPRLWGTFPRVLGKYTRDLNLLELEQAVHKMTGLAAATFGLCDRGLLKPGFIADITVFDRHTIADRATFERPREPSAGIEYVFVSGRVTWDHGRPVGERNGRYLRRQLAAGHN